MSEDVPVSDEKSSSSNPEPESSKTTQKCVISLQTMVPIARPKIRRNKKRTIKPQAPITTHEVTSFAISHAYSQDTGDIAIKPQDHVWKREPNRIEHDPTAALSRTSEKTTFSPTYTSSLQLSKSSTNPIAATEASTVKINNAYRFPMGVPETVSSTAHRREPPSSHLPWLPPPPSLIPLPLPPQLTSYLVDGPVRTRRGGGFGSVREHQLYAGASSGALAAAIVAKSTKYDKSGNVIQNPDESLPPRMDASEGKSIGTRYAIQSQKDTLSSTNTTNAPISPSNPTSSRTEASTAAVTSVTPAHAPKPNLGAVELMPSSAPYHPLQQVRVAAGALVTKYVFLSIESHIAWIICRSDALHDFTTSCTFPLCISSIHRRISPLHISHFTTLPLSILSTELVASRSIWPLNASRKTSKNSASSLSRTPPPLNPTHVTAKQPLPG